MHVLLCVCCVCACVVCARVLCVCCVRVLCACVVCVCCVRVVCACGVCVCVCACVCVSVRVFVGVCAPVMYVCACIADSKLLCVCVDTVCGNVAMLGTGFRAGGHTNDTGYVSADLQHCRRHDLCRTSRKTEAHRPAHVSYLQARCCNNHTAPRQLRVAEFIRCTWRVTRGLTPRVGCLLASCMENKVCK